MSFIKAMDYNKMDRFVIMGWALIGALYALYVQMAIHTLIFLLAMAVVFLVDRWEKILGQGTDFDYSEKTRFDTEDKRHLLVYWIAGFGITLFSSYVLLSIVINGARAYPNDKDIIYTFVSVASVETFFLYSFISWDSGKKVTMAIPAIIWGIFGVLVFAAFHRVDTLLVAAVIFGIINLVIIKVFDFTTSVATAHGLGNVLFGSFALILMIV